MLACIVQAPAHGVVDYSESIERLKYLSGQLRNRDSFANSRDDCRQIEGFESGHRLP